MHLPVSGVIDRSGGCDDAAGQVTCAGYYSRPPHGRGERPPNLMQHSLPTQVATCMAAGRTFLSKLAASCRSLLASSTRRSK